MKKLLKAIISTSFVLIICGFICGCNLFANSEVSDEQWQTALSVEKYVITVESSDTNESKYIVYVDGGLVRIQKMIEGSVEISYIEVEDNEYWGYTKTSSVTWAKTSITENIYKKHTYKDITEELNFEDFTYSSETKTYKAENLSINSTVQDVEIKFDNLKVSEIVITGTQTLTLKYSYETNFTINLPSEIESGTVDIEGWT